MSDGHEWAVSNCGYNGNTDEERARERRKARKLLLKVCDNYYAMQDLGLLVEMCDGSYGSSTALRRKLREMQKGKGDG